MGGVRGLQWSAWRRAEEKKSAEISLLFLTEHQNLMFAKEPTRNERKGSPMKLHVNLSF